MNCSQCGTFLETAADSYDCAYCGHIGDVDPEIISLRAELEKVNTENAKLKTALSGRTYVHDNPAVEKLVEELTAELEKVKGELELQKASTRISMRLASTFAGSNDGVEDL